MSASPEMAALVEMLRLAAGDAATARIMHMHGWQPSPLTMAIAAQANDALLDAIAKLEAARDEATRRLAVVEARPLTVGAALALPEVQSGACVVEACTPTIRTPFQCRPTIDRIEERSQRSDGDWGWWRRIDVDGPFLALPCRLVPLAIADANPATRGEMP